MGFCEKRNKLSEINGYMALDRAKWRERVILLTLIDWSHWTQGFVWFVFGKKETYKMIHSFTKRKHTRWFPHTSYIPEMTFKIQTLVQRGILPPENQLFEMAPNLLCTAKMGVKGLVPSNIPPIKAIQVPRLLCPLANSSPLPSLQHHLICGWNDFPWKLYQAFWVGG